MCVGICQREDLISPTSHYSTARNKKLGLNRTKFFCTSLFPHTYRITLPLTRSTINQVGVVQFYISLQFTSVSFTAPCYVEVEGEFLMYFSSRSHKCQALRPGSRQKYWHLWFSAIHSLFRLDLFDRFA